MLASLAAFEFPVLPTAHFVDRLAQTWICPWETSGQSGHPLGACEMISMVQRQMSVGMARGVAEEAAAPSALTSPDLGLLSRRSTHSQSSHTET